MCPSLVKTPKKGVLALGKNEFESKKRINLKKWWQHPRKDKKKQLAFCVLLVYNIIVFNGQIL